MLVERFFSNVMFYVVVFFCGVLVFVCFGCVLYGFCMYQIMQIKAQTPYTICLKLDIVVHFLYFLALIFFCFWYRSIY